MKELERIFYTTDEGSNGGDQSTESNETTKDESSQEKTQPYKAFTSEEEYSNVLKSERSKAKNEILQELGIKGVKEGKEQLQKASTLESELTTYKNKSSELEEQLVLTKTGIKDEYKEEALALAKGKVNDETNLETALGEVVKKFPLMKGSGPTINRVGGENNNSKHEEDSDQGNIKNNLKSKYPWLDL